MEAVDILGRIDGAEMTFCASICGGSGNCTRMPFTAGSALSCAISASNSVSLASAGSLLVESVHAGLRHRLGFVADVDFAGGIFADQNDGETRHDAAVAQQTMHGIGHLAAQVGCDWFCRR